MEKIKQHLKNIEKFDKDRIFWLRLSGFVIVAILIILVDVSLLRNYTFYWLIIAGGLIITVSWWYWTMALIRELIGYRTEEVEILTEIVDNIKDVKEEVKKIAPPN